MAPATRMISIWEITKSERNTAIGRPLSSFWKTSKRCIRSLCTYSIPISSGLRSQMTLAANLSYLEALGCLKLEFKYSGVNSNRFWNFKSLNLVSLNKYSKKSIASRMRMKILKTSRKGILCRWPAAIGDCHAERKKRGYRGCWGNLDSSPCLRRYRIRARRNLWKKNKKKTINKFHQIKISSNHWRIRIRENHLIRYLK